MARLAYFQGTSPDFSEEAPLEAANASPVSL